ncbi:hypothetical protein [Mesomycoplasma ovipneumoniae]|uniref:hypothetical protein n=1 Tax=Mesomycoplasma ovipneumoniae TaxID=29562 RepID=UPI00311CE091
MKSEIEFNFYKEILEQKAQDVYSYLGKSFQKVSVGAPNPQLISHIKVSPEFPSLKAKIHFLVNINMKKDL